MKRISIAVSVLVVGVLVIAGCGGSSGGSTESGNTTATAGSRQAKKGGMFNISEEAKACLKEKGVELPEFKSGEGGPPGSGEGEKPKAGELPEGGPPGGFGGEGSEEMKKAFEECGVETPEFKGGAGGKPSTKSAAFKKQVKEYAACVRENGFELAEPDFSGEGPVFEKAESESAAFKKASEGCRELLGGPQGSESQSG